MRRVVTACFFGLTLVSCANQPAAGTAALGVASGGTATAEVSDDQCLREAQTLNGRGHYMEPSGLLAACHLQIPLLDGDRDLQRQFTFAQLPYITRTDQPNEGKVWSLCYAPHPVVTGPGEVADPNLSGFTCRSFAWLNTHTADADDGWQGEAVASSFHPDNHIIIER